MNLKHEVRELVEGFLAEEITTTISAEDVRYVLQRLCDECRYGSQKAVAGAIGISEQYLHDLVRGNRNAGPKVLQAMGMVECVSYRLEVAA